MNKIVVLDLETDPFEYGQMIQPFVAGFYDGSRYISIWSEDCVKRLVEILLREPEPLTIYAHNGGRFDFFYFLQYLEKDLRIVNGRIIQARLGKHELRDSYAIMPFPLEQYKKTKIDYENFRKGRRERHKEEIISYLRDDCVDLHTLCIEFAKEFGDVLTVGSAAMKQLKRFHKFATGNKEYDAKFRDKFYFGGRVQVFKSGIIKGNIEIYDVNSMYPYVMKNYLHPVGTGMLYSNRIERNTAFVVVEGRNKGAFPVRAKNGSLDFTVSEGIFYTSIHEFEAAVQTGCFIPRKIHKTIGFLRREPFAEFVEHFYAERLAAKKAGDKIHALFYKYILNSGYGKFAQNPENYNDWRITLAGDRPADWHDCVKSCEPDCKLVWSPAFMNGDFIIWSRPLQKAFYYNIATGASITGAARAILLRGINAAKDPIYCDTDSIICRGVTGLQIHSSELGAWKREAVGTMAAICGKKLYAIFDSRGECIKKAHKGARLSGKEILAIAKGNTIEACNPVPSFKWDGSYTFTKRQIKRTV